jgi:hypothetical protein
MSGVFCFPGFIKTGYHRRDAEGAENRSKSKRNRKGAKDAKTGKLLKNHLDNTNEGITAETQGTQRTDLKAKETAMAQRAQRQETC